MGVQPLHGKGPHPLLWTGSRAARGRIISGVSNSINYSVIFTVYIYIYIFTNVARPHNSISRGRGLETHVTAKKRFYEIVHSDRVVGGV